MASCTSPSASSLTLPISRVISRASDAFFASRIVAVRRRNSARRGAGVADQPGNAASAAATARSTSAAVLFGARPIVSPVAGSVVSRKRAPASSQVPPIRLRA